MKAVKKLEALPRVRLAALPTPLEELPRLTEHLGGPTILVKRDDLTGLAFGGNKTRKLEFHMAEVLKSGADVVITTSGVQSNWVRQTVAAARRLGLRAAVVLRTAQFKEIPKEYDGNLLVDHILGADIRIVKGAIDLSMDEALEEVAEEYRSRGAKPYIITAKRSESSLSSVAYVAAFQELMGQAWRMGFKPTHIVLASGGGATQGGLLAGARLLGADVEVLGVNVGAFPQEVVARMAREAAEGVEEYLGVKPALGPGDVRVLDDYRFGGYGVTPRPVVDVIRQVAELEGLLLDPVYTAKAMAGLIDLAKRGELGPDHTVVFLHTGGLPALFPYRHIFQ